MNMLTTFWRLVVCFSFFFLPSQGLHVSGIQPPHFINLDKTSEEIAHPQLMEKMSLNHQYLARHIVIFFSQL